MDNRDSFLDSRRKAHLSVARNLPDNKSKRLSQPDGDIIHIGIKRNRIKMGELIKGVLNTLGLMTFFAGILANLDNVASVLLGFVGGAYGVIKILHAIEVLRMKRIDRKEHEDKYKNK